MGYRAEVLFTQPFVSQSRVIVAHNLDIEYPGVRLLIDNEIRPDLILGAAPDIDDPTNRLVIRLTGSQTGVIQIVNYDIQPLGTQSATILALTGFGAKLVFGEEYTYAEDRTASTTSSTTPVQKLRLTTPNVPLGSYRVKASFLWNLNSASNDFRAQLELDDTLLLWSMSAEPKDASTTEDINGAATAQFLLGAGEHTIDLDYYVETGTTTGRIKEARLEFWRN